jgi:hypothetical protein
MKHLKNIGLFAIAAASLMAFAGSASAITLTSPTGTEFTGTMPTSLEGSALIKAGFAEITCTAGTLSVNVTTNNETEASGSITGVSFSSCKEGQTVDTLNNNGTLTMLKSTHAVSGTGMEITTAVAGVSCVYGLGATSTSLGGMTNTVIGGVDKITIDVGANFAKDSGGFLCASPAAWTAHYVVTSPATSFFD